MGVPLMPSDGRAASVAVISKRLDQEDIIQKFARLLERLKGAPKPTENAAGAMAYFEVKQALNLLARTAGENSVYYRKLLEIGGDKRIVNASILSGILTTALTDLREGFMASVG
jgi:hypothetical protein